MNSIEPPSFTTFQLINYAQFGQTELVFLLILCILLLLSALISGSEAAFFSLSPKDKEALKEDDGKKAAYTTRLLKKPKELLATILITNNFVNVAIVILSSSLLNKLSAHSDSIEALRFLFEVVLITFVLLILGEVIPKIYATKNALGFSKMMGRFLFFLNKTPPISWIRLGLVSSSGFIQRKFKKRMVDISSDELEAALALTKESDTEDDDHKILEGIVNFGKTEVRQIMKPRLDVYAIETTSSFKEVMAKILDCGHSRIPVYEETFDTIKGILFIKDLLPFLGSNESVDWLKLIREPFFVPENKKIDDLLKEFQEKKVHIALVVDEYGGTNGIITLEDILEEIVGEITDEFDNDKVIYTKINNHTYLFEGKTALIDFIKVLQIDEDEFDSKNAETLGGFIIEEAGRIPINNEFIQVGNLKLIIESSDKRKINMVKIIRNEQTK
tara:strand:- start:796 stop:2130 length:1335 start_codon:yes stop_codon:yes gene_type:complete